MGQAGVINVITYVNDLGGALTSHPDVAKIIEGLGRTGKTTNSSPQRPQSLVLSENLNEAHFTWLRDSRRGAGHSVSTDTLWGHFLESR